MSRSLDMCVMSRPPSSCCCLVVPCFTACAHDSAYLTCRWWLTTSDRDNRQSDDLARYSYSKRVVVLHK